MPAGACPVPPPVCQARPVTPSDAKAGPGSRRPFYGWAVVAAVFVMLATSAGLGFYTLALYLRTLTAEAGFSVSSVSGATALFFVVSGLTGVGVGHVIARRDPRPVIAAGAVAAGVAVVMLSRVDQLWQVYVTYAAFGAGFACCALVPGTTLVTRWFHRRRAVALSVAFTGLSIGGIALTPVASALIGRWGFEDASVWIGAGFVLGVIPVTALVLRPDPAVLGLRPDGDEAPEGEGEDAPASSGIPYGAAVRSRAFAGVTLVWTLALLSQVGAISHLVSVVSERVDRPSAALALSVMAGCSIVGRLIGGVALLRVPTRSFALATLAVQAAGSACLALAEGRPVLLASAALFGLAVGNILLLQPVILAEVFGVADYGRIFSLSQLISTAGVAAGPVVLGLLHDVAGGYRVAYLVAASLSLLGLAALAGSGPLAPFEDGDGDGAVPAVSAAGGITLTPP